MRTSYTTLKICGKKDRRRTYERNIQARWGNHSFSAKNSNYLILNLCLYSWIRFRVGKSHLFWAGLYYHLNPVRPQHVLPHYLLNRTFTALPRQQTNRKQGNTTTHLDIQDRAMGMQQAIRHQDPPNIPVKNAQNDQQCPWYVSNQTLHSDFEIQYVTEVVRTNANKHKNRSTEHSNQLIRAHFNQ